MTLFRFILPVLLFTGSCNLALAQTDVTAPGDPIVRVVGANDGDADAGPPPVAATGENAINDTG
jgi:hypothetical protein